MCKKTTQFRTILLFNIVFWWSSSLFAQRQLSVIVVNTTNLQRIDELIVFKRAFLKSKLKQLTSKDFVIVKHNDQQLVVQQDDLNRDGIWDEAVFLHSFNPKEEVSFSISVSGEPAQLNTISKAHVRQKHKLADNSFGKTVLVDTMPYNNLPTDFNKQKLPPYLTEGPAWENDKVGFRKYFDIRNANDLWGKTTGKMVMDLVGVNPDSIYHKLNWWGMDILKVGRSLGAGAIALKIPLKQSAKDTLLRLGSNAKHIIYRSVADGPVRAIFSITYEECKVAANMQSITVIEIISIWGGQYFYNNEVWVQNAPKGTKLITGIPDFYECAVDSIKTRSSVVMYSYGKQSENSDTLTMAVMIPLKSFDKIDKTRASYPNISNAYLISQQIENDKRVGYRFYSLWQLTDKIFADKKNIQSFLIQQAVFNTKSAVT